MDQLVTVFHSLCQIVLSLGDLVVQVLALAMQWSLLIAWVAWWLCGVNWHKTWQVLARGAWAPVVLLMLVSAHVWSHIEPCQVTVGIFTIGNYWWQLGAVCLLVAITLFCGWLQGVFHWTPPEINLDPPLHAEVGHGHAY